MNDCAFCRKKFILKFIMSVCDLKATDIAREVNVSDSLVRKHINGVRNCRVIDAYLINKGFGIEIKDYSING